MSEEDKSKTNPDPDVSQDDKKGQEEQKQTDAQKEQERIDKIVSDRLKREREKSEKEVAERLKKEREEWERQAKLSAEEREAEARKRQQQETEAREREITLRENRAEARELLQEKNISANLVDLVVDTDMDKTKERIEELAQAYMKDVEKLVNDRLKGTTPKDKSTQTTPKPQAPRVF